MNYFCILQSRKYHKAFAHLRFFQGVHAVTGNALTRIAFLNVNLQRTGLFSDNSRKWTSARYALFTVSFRCAVGVNPAPTVPSRSSSPCIAPWQLYCTSFLGHGVLHSGCFPSVCVEESGGPSLLQYFIPISDRYKVGGEAAFALLTQNVDKRVTGPAGTVRAQTCPVLVLFVLWQPAVSVLIHLLHSSWAVTLCL